MPLKEKVGPRAPPSALWLKTMSTTTSSPLRCSSRTIVFSSRTCSPRPPLA